MKWFRRKKPNRLKTNEEPRRFKRLVAWVAGGLTLIVAATLAFDYLARTDWERFRTLEVTGELKHVSVEDVRSVLVPHIEQGFAAINMRAARESVEALPWVAEATVRRQWPGTLLVDLQEERPVATWFGTALMNSRGEVFIDGAAGYSGVLPDVGGPRGTQQDMVDRLQELRQKARDSGFDLHRLVRTDRRAERFWLGNGIEVRLGRRDVDARLDRFLNTAWPSLQADAGQVEYVDMRYTNGFAVGWKTANGEPVAGERANVQENG